jgi:hypothetical protein
LETQDQLVRLNIGPIPIEASVRDWAAQLGFLLFQRLTASGCCRYLSIPLNIDLILSIPARSSKGAFPLYRDSRGHPTPIAKFVALFCLQEDVPIPAICRELGVSESCVRLMRRRCWQARETGRAEGMELLLMLAFETQEQA